MTLSAPAPLRFGDEIYIFAPSGAFDRALFEAGVQLVREAGFLPLVDPDVFARQDYLAGSDETRTAAFKRALDSGAKAIWAARGGYGATRILPQVQRLISEKENLPWLVGFSDITVLHGLWQRKGFMSLHAANITTLSVWSETARQEIWSVLQGMPGTMQREGIWQRLGDSSEHIEGVLAGGNLSMLTALCGTGFLPSFKDRIVLLEDIGEAPYRLDRAVTQLHYASDFSKARAVVLGQFSKCGEGSAGEGVVLKEMTAWGLGVLHGVGIGHDACSVSAVLGRNARIDTVRGAMELI